MSEARLSVAAIQLNSQDDVGRNLAECGAWVARAAQAGAQVILLPENFAFFGPEADRRRVAEPPMIGMAAGGPIQAALAGFAREHGVTIVAGGMPIRSGDAERPYNACVAFAADGRPLAQYNKMHLFDVSLADGTELRESASTQAGDDVVAVALGSFTLGLSICYDLRFPELYRRLVDAGADVLLVPAAFTLHTGKDHWEPLLRARAIESQAWVVAAGQWGSHPGGRRCFGHSMVIDPWGAVLARCPDRTGMVVATLERPDLERVRASVPSLAHRRL